MIRKPAVAGLFYDNNPEDLKKTIEWCFNHELGPGKIPKLGKKSKDLIDEINSHDKKIYGSIIPHAGYIYSGPIAAHTYYELVETGFPETFIILCPNHTGLGSEISIYSEGAWDTPLGRVVIDESFANTMISKSDIITSDSSAHLKEHSCEVHLPFLQYFSNDFKIVPIVMGMQDIETSTNLANVIVETANELNTSISIIGSTDLTHYKPREIAQKQDNLIMDAIAKMDEFALLRYIDEIGITMCGYGTTVATIKASRAFGAKSGKILKYATSGDISGDFSSVVGYCSAIFQ
ncbi:hypothetical protein MBCUT_00300 [Methanobrevibacter cuticularis]|uniref:MEMO1 family protein MBCUT_00300 n=1 Tax=Methanobrevibacter cuticularis TaxID=47311 RepID=A0A166FJD4_9EURY|nr:AmmeMemoRadiSam system protein B [Methanobrevibacter cuticularis]KZX17736.1 hypothetical protein MBCUT_00300 [Methanobrevibacter cuticularis]